MKITKISYRTNVLVPATDDCKPSYRSKHVEAEATLADGDNASVALVQLAEWVHVQLGLARPVPAPKPALRDLGDEDLSYGR